jgi:hypothetical protein
VTCQAAGGEASCGGDGRQRKRRGGEGLFVSLPQGAATTAAVFPSVEASSSSLLILVTECGAGRLGKRMAGGGD